MMSFICSSQTGMMKDTSKMTFSTNTIRLISKELIQKDGLEKENILLYNKIKLLEDINTNKDFIIDAKNKIIYNGDLKEDELIYQNSLYIDENKKLISNIAKEKRKTLFFKITTGVAIISSIFIAIK